MSPKDSFYLGAEQLAATTITYPYITVKSEPVASGEKEEHVQQPISRILRERARSKSLQVSPYSSKNCYSMLTFLQVLVPRFMSVITAAFAFAFKLPCATQQSRLTRTIAKKAASLLRERTERCM